VHVISAEAQTNKQMRKTSILGPARHMLYVRSAGKNPFLLQWDLKLVSYVFIHM